MSNDESNIYTWAVSGFYNQRDNFDFIKNINSNSSTHKRIVIMYHSFKYRSIEQNTKIFLLNVTGRIKFNVSPVLSFAYSAKNS